MRLVKYCMIETAFDNKDELNIIIKVLLENQLVGSCQVIESDIKWNSSGEYEEAKEYLLLMKTKKSLSSKIYGVIKSIHTYACFEIAVFDLESCNQDYLNWIENETI